MSGAENILWIVFILYVGIRFWGDVERDRVAVHRYVSWLRAERELLESFEENGWSLPAYYEDDFQAKFERRAVYLRIVHLGGEWEW